MSRRTSAAETEGEGKVCFECGNENENEEAIQTTVSTGWDDAGSARI